MRKLFLGLALSFIATAASAEWIFFTNSGDKDVVVYVEPTTKQQNSNLVKAWFLFDYKTRQEWANKMYLSLKAQYQFNCVERVSRLVYVAFYKDNKVNHGDAPVHTVNTPNNEWSPDVPDSIDGALAEWACTK